MLIFLVGYMGAGKSSVGELLALKLNYRFIDTDNWIENRCCRSISDVFKESGEAYFREKEKECIEFLVDANDIVVATGGGLPCTNGLMDLMNELGEVVYLKTNTISLSKRLFKELKHRPVLSKIQSERELSLFITKQLSNREPYYNTSKHIIYTNKKSQTDLAEELYLLF
jgi:shikimate kinase